MRPIRLKMSAFGPFAGTEVIEFELLGVNPLFLINGPTGAGKTTILDAICFSLYGETTGVERDVRDMRSQHADPTLLTEVAFEFELRGARYRIDRIPEQQRPKAKGEGFTRQPAKATFVELAANGAESIQVERKVTDANEAIVRLTGLNAEQFRQVMVLPQGRFREFLLADSKNREVIFEQLFQTHAYSEIEERLKSAASQQRRAREELKNQLEGVLKGVDQDSVEQLTSSIELLSPKVAGALQAKQAADTALVDTKTELTHAAALRERFEKFDDERSRLDGLKQQAKEYRELDSTLDAHRRALRVRPTYELHHERQQALQSARESQSKALAKLEAARVELERATSASEQAGDQRDNLEALRSQQQTLEGYRVRVMSLDEANEDAKQCAERRAQAETGHSEAAKELVNAQETSKELAKRLDDAKAQLAERPQKILEREQLEGARESISQRAVLTKTVSGLSEQVKSYGEKLKRLQAAADKAITAREHMEEAWHLGQARLLSAELVPGEPCPVCGSIEHPRPAADDDNVPTQADVEAARVTAGNAERARSNLAQRMAVSQSELQAEESRLKELPKPKAFDGLDDMKAVKKACGELDELIAGLDQVESEIPALEADLARAESSLEALQKDVGVREQSVHSLKIKEAEAKKAKALASGELPKAYRSLEALEEALNLRGAQRHELENALKEIDVSLESARHALTSCGSTVRAAADTLKSAEQGADVTANDWMAAISEAQFEEEADYLAALMPDDVVTDSERRFTAYRSSLESARTMVSSLESELADKRSPDLQHLERLIAVQEKAQADADEIHSKLMSERDGLMRAAQIVTDMQSQLNVLDEEYEVVGTLSEVSNGSNGLKLSLQRFVLSVLLDDVLEQASVRLRSMSKGRYDLCRAAASGGRSASGLELEVLDGYTGGARSVSTLSGGESFMAALALALGLSDVVQAYAGGIRLDALFIDEGFGSLDSESLDLAINTLIDLKASGRMVGIISHVAELKERINVRMDVRSGREGASVQIHA